MGGSCISRLVRKLRTREMSDEALKPATLLTSYVINIDESWHVPPPKQTGFKSGRLCCEGLPSTDGLSVLTIYDNQPAKEGHCR